MISESMISKSPEVKPQAFQIVLCKVGSSFGSRQTVTNNGRYRFMDVQNGDYEIVVESDGRDSTDSDSDQRTSQNRYPPRFEF